MESFFTNFPFKSRKMIFEYKKTITPNMEVKNLKTKLCDTIKLMASKRPCDCYKVDAGKEFPSDNDDFEEFVFDVIDDIGANLYEFYLPSNDIFEAYFKFIYNNVDMRCYIFMDTDNMIYFCIGFCEDCCSKLVTLDD